ncbi:hypothetical protein [Halorussus ruber]|uniref:hypothetical protein n=1 Tax=Halorussus ruber TaxID=1126238 RepID=UPI001091D14F|nr:hypothetical protein [Halorussus ruber]
MARRAFLSAVLTKRGVILALVVGVALLGAGFGFLPALLGGSDDPGGPADGATPTASASGETAETASEESGTGTVAERGETPASVATTERSDGTAGSDGGTAGRTLTTDSAGTADGTAEDGTEDDEPDDETGNGPAEVGVRAESNASASSLADYPSRSRRLNAVVNPPNAARTAGGA